jgi:branched-chain amino acid aminotransferase
MEAVAYWNGRFVPAGEARLPILTHALQYGTAVLDLIGSHHDARTGESLLFRPLDHFERLERDARLLDIRLPGAAGELVGVAAELVRLNAFEGDAFLRAIAYKPAERIDPGPPPGDGFALVALPAGTGAGRETVAPGNRVAGAPAGLHCGVSTWRRTGGGEAAFGSRVAGACLVAALASREAGDRGFDDAILLDASGCVCGGACTDLFVLRAGRLATPGAAQGAPGGITRDALLVLARDEMNLEAETRAVERAELYAADEVFLCGTAASVAPVVRIDGRQVGTGRPGPATLGLGRFFEDVVRGRVAKYRPWLVPAYGYTRVAAGA